MAEPGNLDWERITAGVYETMFYANNYLYKIEKSNSSRWGNTPAWQPYYRWRFSKDKSWKKLGSFTELTLKLAKDRCVKHNLVPRRKFRFTGIVTLEETRKNPSLIRYLGYHKFVPIDRKNGQPAKYSNTCYIKPPAMKLLEAQNV